MGGWGAAPLARSTPTRAQRRDTPKKATLNFLKNTSKITNRLYSKWLFMYLC
ncbi:MAG: hypothetical protein NZ455_02150 [Bacteroidia bacterium]|nr:hypothetical protein [Bacteroidia bacterium]MDW8347816.1 hypothetical protein [Bacteroidia bacterium]